MKFIKIKDIVHELKKFENFKITSYEPTKNYRKHATKKQ